MPGTLTGTYKVKPDCTYSDEYTPAPGIVLHTAGAIIGSGILREIHYIWADTRTVMFGTARKTPERACSLEILKGNYALLGHGTVTAQLPGLPPPPVLWAQSGVLTADGAGHFVGQNTETVGGTVMPGDRYTATYTVKPDCTTSVTVNTSLGLVVHGTGTIAGLGEWQGIFTDEGWIMATIVSPTAESRVKPWNGTWTSGDATIVGKCENGTLLFVESGTGYMDHMGKTAWSNRYCMDPVTWKGSGEAVETAENGDEIRVQTSPQFTWTSPTGGTWVETEVVVSGTGRFAEAMGFTESSGTFILTSPTTAVWQGTSKGVLSF